MGTRNLTMVYLNGEYKVAQYGQWDGYPEGQGINCLHFLRDECDDMERFEQAVGNCSFMTEEEENGLLISYGTRSDGYISMDDYDKFSKDYPELSRDTGARILPMVYERNGLRLVNSIEFASDGLFCEWAWLIDLDANTFEAYEGFNKEPLTEDDRFYFLRDKESDHEFENKDGTKYVYHGVKLAAKWSLDDLPSDEDFLAAFKEEEDE